MGCTNARQQSTFEENYLRELQSKLGFDNAEATEVDLIIHKYSFNNFINPTQLRLIETELQLTLHDPGEWPEVSLMMSYLENSLGWESQKLIILGVLCSNSNAHIKAKLLFEAFDENFTGQLTSTQISRMLTDMCMISSQALGALAVKDQKNAPVIERYLRKCVTSAERSVLNLMKHFKPTTSDSEFVMTLATLHDGLLLSPAGIRNYLYVEYSRNGPGKDFSNITRVRSRINSLGSVAGSRRSAEFAKPDILTSFETNSTQDEPERGSSGHLSSVDFDLSRLH